MIRLLAAVLLASSASVALAEAPPGVDGKAVYTKRCAGCHGADGKADTKQGHKYKIADFTDPKWAKDWDRAHVKDTVAKGVKGKMPAWGEKLSPEEIDAVSAYVFVLAGAK